tara:strand:+ start:478 stop:810 length:333 start_codon:yes stop_codon:yes gene_type:complete
METKIAYHTWDKNTTTSRDTNFPIDNCKVSKHALERIKDFEVDRTGKDMSLVLHLYDSDYSIVGWDNISQFVEDMGAIGDYSKIRNKVVGVLDFPKLASPRVLYVPNEAA